MATRTKTSTAKTSTARKPATTAPRTTRSTKAKTTAAKASTRASKPTASKPAPVAPKVTPKPAPTAAAPQVTERARIGDLLDAVSDRSPLRRADVKAVMELMLEEMGKRVDAGQELILPPLGKLTTKKRVERPGGDMLTVKLKRLTPGGSDS